MLSLIKVVKFDCLISFTDCYIILKYLIVLYLEESFMNFRLPTCSQWGKEILSFNCSWSRNVILAPLFYLRGIKLSTIKNPKFKILTKS